MIEFEKIKNNNDVQILIAKSDEYLKSIGYTVHGLEHVEEVTRRAEKIAQDTELDEYNVQASCIAAYLHDIGNFLGRENHQLSGALIAFNILKEMNIDIDLISKVTMAIASHDETNGEITDKVSAVLVLADKSHVHKNRVRGKDPSKFDIHDRVNYAVQESELLVNRDRREIWLNLIIDVSVSTVMDYFEIFLNRMLLCRKAANVLGYNFHLKINESVLY